MKKASRLKGRLNYKPGDVLLSHTLARAVPSGLRSLTAVFGMGTGGSSSLGSPRNWGQPRLFGRALNIDGLFLTSKRKEVTFLLFVCSRDYGQAERAISNGQLNALLRLHIRP